MARSTRGTGSASCRGHKTTRCGLWTRRRGRRSARRCRTGARSIAHFIRRTVSASSRGLKATRSGFGTRRRGRRSARRCRTENGAVYSSDGKRILSWSKDLTLRLWDVSWQGDNLFEIACKFTPMMSAKAEMNRLSKRYGVRIEEPICQPGVKIPDPDWRRTEPAHAETPMGAWLE